MAILTEAQRSALRRVTEYARGRRTVADGTIGEILRMSNIPRDRFADAVRRLKAKARVALHFHPDRPDAKMMPVAERLLDQGLYLSQFETGLSSGSLSAYAGGERDEWEKRVFGGAYQQYAAADRERPKYGALDLMLHPDGPSPRFGSCYLLLSPGVSSRCTFTYLDSHEDRQEKGTYEEFEDILAALMKDAFSSDCAIGERDLTPVTLVDHLVVNLNRPFTDPSGGQPRRNLNHYIEAQVHGDLALAEDADILVADPSFAGTAIGGVLEEICARYAIDLYWHMGFVLREDEVPSDFRGPSMPSLAKRIARDGLIDASTLGAAAMDLKRDPGSWSDRGTYEEVLQELKLLWHVLVRCGKPWRSFHQ